MIDLRSDTVTRPTEAMWKAMHNVPVGDDVFREDPQINSLEEKIARLFEKEEGLFVPSGTMGNQLGIKVHTEPGDEVILDENAHIYHSEGAAGGLISGIQLRPLPGKRGLLSAPMIVDAIRNNNDWDPRTRLVALENTSNRAGGSCYPINLIEDIYHATREHQLALHIDGARIWNASAATNTPLRLYGRYCDTISVCFSKGLGAPVGSMLLGDKTTISRARRFRKILGGGMRQAGMLAAAASYAVDHHFELLKYDHLKAKMIAEALHRSPFFEINPEETETNIVLFRANQKKIPDILQWFQKQNIAIIPFGGDTLRATLHFEISEQDTDKVIRAIRSYKE